MHTPSSAQDLRVWTERPTAHFSLLYVPGSYAAGVIDDVEVRAEAAYRRSLTWLAGDEPPLPITLHLVNLVPGPRRAGWDQLAGSLLATNRSAAWLLITPESPAVGLERITLELFARAALGSVRHDADGFLRGLAGLLAAENGAGPPTDLADQQAREQYGAGKGTPRLFEGVDPRLFQTADPGEVSFLGFLQRTRGRAGFGRFVRAVLADGLAAAAPATYALSLAALQGEWLTTLGTPPRASTAALDIIRHSIPFIRRHWLREVELFAYMILALVFSLAIPLSVKFLFDDVLTARDVALLGTWAVVVLVLFAISSVAGYRRGVVAGLIGELVLRDLRRAGFTHLQALGLRFYTRSRTGDLLSRLTNDMDDVQGVLGGTLPDLIFEVISLVVGAIFLLALNWMLGLLVIMLGLPILVVVYTGTSQRLRQASRELSDRIGSMTAFLQEHLSAQMIVKSFSLERRSIAAFEEHLATLFGGSMRMIRLGAILSGSTSMVYLGVQVVVLAVGAALVMSDRMSTGELVAFSGLIGQVLSPAMSISSEYRALQTATGSFDRIRELMDEAPDVTEAPQAVTLGALQHEIRLERVTFSYDEGDPVLQDISLAIPVGSRVAIVGPSGSGKSTIVGLLLRLYDVDEGRVLFDGRDAREVTVDSLRGQMAVVPQDTYLFDTSIGENIALGREGAGRSEVVRAAEAAELQQVIERVEGGYDSVVGERGMRLSGGQRQRLAIARALIRDPRVLILDEATSALDPHTEAGILRTLDTVGRGRTTIMITHRLSSAVGCDLIFVLDQGRLVEQGSHDELFQQRGLYWQLYTEQQQAGEVAGPASPDGAYEIADLPAH